MLEVISVEYIGNHTLSTRLSNGREGRFDLSPYIGKGVFKQLADEGYAKQVKINFAGVCWPNGQDFSANTLDLELQVSTLS